MIEARVWQHKKSKKKVTVLPWLEVPETDFVKELDLNKALTDRADRQIKIGVLVQIGWMLQNSNDVWIGVGLNAAKEFKDIGVFVPKKKKE